MDIWSFVSTSWGEEKKKQIKYVVPYLSSSSTSRGQMVWMYQLTVPTSGIGAISHERRVICEAIYLALLHRLCWAVSYYRDWGIRSVKETRRNKLLLLNKLACGRSSAFSYRIIKSNWIRSYSIDMIEHSALGHSLLFWCFSNNAD